MRRHVAGLVLGILTFSISVGSIWLWREMNRAVSEVPAHLEQPTEPVSLREINTLTNAPQPVDNYFAKFRGIMVTEGYNAKAYLDLPKLKKQKDWIALYRYPSGKVELRRVKVKIDDPPVRENLDLALEYFVDIQIVGNKPDGVESATYLFAGLDNLKTGDMEMAKFADDTNYLSLTILDEAYPEDNFFSLAGTNYWVKSKPVYDIWDGGHELKSATAFLSDGIIRQYLVNTNAPGAEVSEVSADFLGDLDGDGKLDMILDVYPKSGDKSYTVLMLSTEAKPGRLLAPAASIKTLEDGC